MIRAEHSLRNKMNTTCEFSKLTKISPKSDTMLSTIENETVLGTPGFRVLCLARRTES